jgi:hypothetical protein
MTEVFCILDWLSEADRVELQEKNKEWWQDAFWRQLQQAENDGNVADIEHWYLDLYYWPYPKSCICRPSAQPPTRQRRFLSKFSFLRCL